jgi:hypothetical protein
MTGQPRPNFRLAKILFIREARTSFEHTHNTSSVAKKKSVQVLEGDATTARR